MTYGALIPQLQTADPDAAERLLMEVFGFAPDGPCLRLGSQRIALVAGPQTGHGVIDHLALAVPEVAHTAQALMARGAQPDLSVTPDGPKEIAEFWQGGVQYFFLQGPGSARIELCSNLAQPAPSLGHDHIGISSTNMAASLRFFTDLGARLLSSVDLSRADGITEVRFLSFHGSVVELYSPPDLRTAPRHSAPGQGLWHSLMVPGLDSARLGPDGLRLVPLPA